MKKKLVIVESPAKSRTIGRILGNDYNIQASMGHIVDLLKSKMGVDIENNFEPSYRIIPNKKKIIKNLKDQASKSQCIYLAADLDREGESICWHLENQFKDIAPIYRVSFNEITKEAIIRAFDSPGSVDLKKVNAQQARRILDRLVGYSLSPLLWQKITRGLSAGRVQSVAVRLIVDREKEIKKFKPQEYWEIEVLLSKIASEEKIKVKLFKIKDCKVEIPNKESIDKIKQDLESSKFFVKEVKKTQRKRYPKPPFITSTLQQAAYNHYKFTADRTMRIAQQLYEGIELGESEATGLITYMRTDSVNISKQSITDVRDFISSNLGEKYLPEDPNIYRSKKGAQKAHEAIRPTYVTRRPEDIKDFLTQDQYKLYEIIWRQFVSSQMQPALFDNVQVLIESGDYLFKATGSTLKFDGYLKINTMEDYTENKLIDLIVEEQLGLEEFIPSQHFTKPPARFSEASLIKELEKKGIGRPSTYAPIIHTIVGRDYVRRNKGYLIPTELGEIVTELLIQHFPKILDFEFTASMEKKLDLIEDGKREKIEVLKEFYTPFKENLEKAKINMKKINKKTIVTEYKCKECDASMVIKWGRWGKFLSCSKFPDCRYSQPLTTEVNCPEESCQGKLIQRRSKKGRIFYGCSKFPNCKYTSSKLPEE